ncbi:fibroblast growth factor receptor 2-like [Ruditapes philippinarum]|uniref:fibroblast growth factor receptor 2-like n=1 Tax=Ruditapes philippinarum TaxID=129788 RepID=UPI00295C02FD|nr:fibroblast growth factor receptor 2-like [Ruditapes philippinarum]
MFTYNSRIKFVASDDGSGVHKLAFKLFSEDGQELYKEDSVMANRNNATDACDVDPSCNCVLNTCFLREQTIYIDNCWFLLPQEELNKSATVVVNVFNQALLSKELVFNISKLSALRGLEEYSGPTNIRVEKNQATGVRLVWDLPEKASCYGRADIKVILVSPDGSSRTVDVYNEGTFVELVGLSPENTYSVSLKLGYRGNELAEIPFSFKTAPKENFLETGALVGIIVGVVVFIAIIAVIFVVLLRRGHMQPIRRGLTAVSVKYRKSISGIREGHRHGAHNKTYDADSLYMYGEMDFTDIENWEFKRADVIFESLITSGHFADIYLATNQKTGSTVVAKTLKKGCSPQDALLMKAKINFSRTQVGHHLNVLNFEGAVVSDSEIGQFLLYEFCSNGQLSDYLATMINQITVETHEKLLRFSLGIVKGMEYLAQRKIVHRRLAARNILLDEDLEVKIAGFGPQPQMEDADGNRGKKERIPIKWMAPECLKSTADATEKSDVWSFAVVLWEIFSLGEKPYEKFSGRDIPGKLKEGYRLPKPEQCEDKWYNMMKRAWSVSPKDRPTFTDMKHDIEGEFTQATTADYYYSNQ